MKLHKSFLIILFVLMLPVVYSLSASIGNARMVLRPTVKEGEITTIDRTIQVNNVNDVAVAISATVDKGLENIVTIPEPEFTLQPGESKEMKFTVTLEYGGRYEGKILIGFKPADDSRKSGVGLSSTIIILAEGPENPNPPTTNQNPENTTETIPPPDTGIEDNETTPIITQTHTTEDQKPTGNNLPKEQKDVTSTSDTSKQTSSAEKKPNPLVGIALIVGIVALGSAIFYVINKRR